ncbi:MAG: SusC/RagA family TonB-linked outer membrane protein, partial [Candidatus Cryptobacteroides sp.]
ITNTISYKWDLNQDHSFNFLIGQEGVDYHYEGFSVSTAGQNNDLLTDISTGTRATSWSSTTDSDYAFLSFFGRAEYNWQQRLYADFSVRADGSSRFGKSGRWAGFWSVGLMWNLRNEKFMESSRGWLTNAQIALSTGTSGNSSIPNYEHLALVGGGLDYVGDAGIAPSQPGNEDLGWEKLWTTNLAFHFGFWNRLDVDLELYNKKTTDMLMEVPQSYASSNGFGYTWSNVGGMVNRGVELNLNAVLLQVRDFTWSVNANVSYNSNRITELYNGVQEYELANTNTKLVVGHPVGEFYINRYAGVNPANGDALWYDKDGNITTEMRDEDKVMIGKTYFAPWQGGFGTNLSWKGLSLSAQFSWVADRWMINNDRYFDESNGRFQSYNQSRRLLDRWKEPGDITDIPRHGVYTEFDSRLLEDASFLRLKNLQIGYSFPQDLMRKTRFIRGIKVYAQGQNLLTATKFSGLDPESSSNIYAAQYPMSRQFTFGLELKF